MPIKDVSSIFRLSLKQSFAAGILLGIISTVAYLFYGFVIAPPDPQSVLILPFLPFILAVFSVVGYLFSFLIIFVALFVKMKG